MYLPLKMAVVVWNVSRHNYLSCMLTYYAIYAIVDCWDGPDGEPIVYHGYTL
jgi:hypothetical protein